MRRKWAVALVLMVAPVAMSACGAELTIPPDPDGGGDSGDSGDGDGASPADAGGSMADSPPSSDGGPTCTPKTCGEVGALCGSAPNGCGGALADCGVCAQGEACGAGGPNRCGDGGCDAATSCPGGHCGTISNGCGGTLGCPGCPGASYCDGNSSTCAACMMVSLKCTDVGDVDCTAAFPAFHLYSCGQAPDPSLGCFHCSSVAGTHFCCP